MSANEDAPNFPEAKVSPTGSAANWFSQSTAMLWIVAAICLAIALILTFRSLSPAGEEIVVHFQNGYGLKAEDQVRYRGIAIGEVEEVELDESLHGISVVLRLSEAATELAREGTRFWIERPKLSLGAVRGLDTLISGRYVAVLPGPESDIACHEFVGTEDPPAMVDVGDGGLPLTLIAENRFGLERGAPITYRGQQVGQVTSTALSTDAMKVEVNAVIEAKYRHLVRSNSRFWNNGGMDLKIGLRGVDVDMDTLSSLAAGGIGFATPQPAGELAPAGQVFELAEEEVEGWQDWQPLLDAGREAIRNRIDNPDPNNPGILNRIRSRFGGSPPSETPNPSDEQTPEL